MAKSIFNFTQTSIGKLPVLKSRKRYKDGGSVKSVAGLVIDVLPSGKKVFRFRRKLGGKDVEVTLGAYPELSLESARRNALDYSAQLYDGQNPNAEKNKQQLALKFDDLFQVYMTDFSANVRLGTRRKTSLQATERLYRLHLKPLCGSWSTEGFGKKEAKLLMIKLKGCKSYAIYNHCLTALKAMFNHSDDFNPFLGMKKFPDVIRERYLDRDELVRLLSAIQAEKVIYQDIIKMLLFTGQRKNCVLSMQWREIDRSARVWTIPTSKMKGKKAHTVPLSVEALKILDRRSANAQEVEEFVFPSNRSKTGHIVEKTSGTSFWQRVIKRAGLYHSDRNYNVRVHDLRRTLASWHINNGGSIQSASKLLGHSDLSITASTYAHLEIEVVREELELTTANMLEKSPNTLSHLKDQLSTLSETDKKQLLALLQAAN